METIISKNIRIRHPEFFLVGDYSVIDDFCYFSTKVNIKNFCHIGPNCTIGGGINTQFNLGNFSSLSSGVKIYCATNNFSEGLVALLPKFLSELDTERIEGDVTFGNYTGVGTNTVVMPNNNIPEGVSIGALSFVPECYPFEEWTVYAGCPIRIIKKRNKENVLSIVAQIEEKLKLMEFPKDLKNQEKVP